MGQCWICRESASLACERCGKSFCDDCDCGCPDEAPEARGEE